MGLKTQQKQMQSEARQNNFQFFPAKITADVTKTKKYKQTLPLARNYQSFENKYSK